MRAARYGGSIAATLVALALPVVALAAAHRPDLTVTAVSKAPAKATAGSAFKLTVTVRNGGKAAAKPTTVAGWLSKDAKAGKGDLELAGALKIGALKPGKQASASKRVTVPGSAKAGTYHVIACADGSKRVKESSEGDNCRVAKGTVKVAGKAAPAPTPTPTPTPTPSPTPTPTPAPSGGGRFPETPNAMTVGAETLDTAHAAENAMMSSGSLIAYGADGTKYTLTLPAGALPSPADITMTPVTAVAGLPFSKGLIGAVHLEPHGLQLLKPATLTIEPTTAAPIAEQTGFTFEQGGYDTHLAPLTSASKLTLPITHFSTPGAARATSADIANVEAHTPVRTQAQLEQALAEIMRAQREQSLGTPVPPGSTDGAVDVFTDYYDHVVLPKLNTAEVNDSAAADAVSAALEWARTAEVLGATDPKITNRETDMWQSIDAILVNAVDKGYQRCKDHDLTQITRLMSFERTALILGLDTNNGFQKALDCAHFQVSFDSEITSSASGPSGGGGTYTMSGDWERAVVKAPMDISGSATVDIPSTKFAYASRNTSACATSGFSTTDDTTSGTPDALHAQLLLFLDLNYREDPPAGQPAVQPRKSFLVVNPSNLGTETYSQTETYCDGSVHPSTFTDFHWYELLEGFHSNAGMLRFDLDPATQVGDELGAEHITHSNSVGNTTSSESTYIEVWHTPQ